MSTTALNVTRTQPLPGESESAPVFGPDSIGFRPFLGIVCLFWLYATVSAVLYAYGMDASMVGEIGKSVFASWEARVIQYLLLLPPLLGCYWWSLRLGWQPRARRVPLQVALGVAFALMARPALWAALELLGEADESRHVYMQGVLGWIRPEIMSMWLASFTDFLVRYGFGLALVTGFAVYKRFRDAEIRVAALERQWSAARLAALRMQLSPHTLFNLLHTIRGQIAWDPPAAQAMVVQLADLLRRLLNAGERDFSGLADELQFVRLYLELQCRRFPERLTISLPDAESVPVAWVPSLILQPLVENAVAHGLAGHDGPVRVEVTARVEGGELRLRVTNSMAAGRGGGPEGIGLRNVRQRLAVQFGGSATFTAGCCGEDFELQAEQPGVGASFTAGRGEGDSWVAEIAMPLLREPPKPRGAGG